jgi:hypothetical protein
MARKARSLYEVFVGSAEQAAGEGDKKESRKPSRKRKPTSSPGTGGLGERQITFSLSLNALAGMAVVLVIFLGGMFALGRFTGPSAQAAIIKAREFFVPGTVGEQSKDAWAKWLADSGFQGVRFQPDPNNRGQVRLLIPLPPEGLTALKQDLARIPAKQVGNFRMDFSRANLDTGVLMTID